MPVIVTGGVYLCDFDRDGRLDMLVTDVNGIALYKGLPDGKFRDVTAEVGLPTRRQPGEFSNVTAFMDIDGDGWDDLILGGRPLRATSRANAFSTTRHFLTCKFPATPPASPLPTSIATAGSISIVPGLAAARRTPGSSGQSGDRMKSNQLWRNKGNWQFEDVTALQRHRRRPPLHLQRRLARRRQRRLARPLRHQRVRQRRALSQPRRRHLRGPRTLSAGPADFGSMGVTLRRHR